MKKGKTQLGGKGSYLPKALAASGIIDLTLDGTGVIIHAGTNWKILLGNDFGEGKGTEFGVLFTPLAKDWPTWPQLAALPCGEYRQGLFRIAISETGSRFFLWTFLRVPKADRPLPCLPLGQQEENILHTPIQFVAVGQDVTDNMSARKKLLRERRNLIERNKELTCLYGISLLNEQINLELPKLLHAILKLVPPAFLYPEQAQARIVLDDETFAIKHFMETPLTISEPLIISGQRRGFIQVGYTGSRPGGKQRKQLKFLQEEQNLLKSIAWQINLIFAGWSWNISSAMPIVWRRSVNWPQGLPTN